MPGWLDAIATWNPLSATAAAIRDLFGNPGWNTGDWASHHPIILAVIWPAVLTVLLRTPRRPPIPSPRQLAPIDPLISRRCPAVADVDHSGSRLVILGWLARCRWGGARSAGRVGGAGRGRTTNRRTMSLTQVAIGAPEFRSTPRPGDDRPTPSRLQAINESIARLSGPIAGPGDGTSSDDQPTGTNQTGAKIISVTAVRSLAGESAMLADAATAAPNCRRLPAVGIG